MRNIIAGLLIILVSGLAVAKEPEGYFGMGYGHTEYTEVGIDGEVNPGVSFIRVGGKTNDYLGVELRAGLGVKDDTINALGYEVATRFDNYYGIYMKVGTPIGPAYPYALLGYSRGEFEVSAGGFSLKMSDDDVSYGLGLSVGFGDRHSLFAEYVQIADTDEFEVTTINLGAVSKF